jgi:hypothetical protein
MLPFAKRFGLSALVGVAVLGLSASSAPAQAIVSPLPQPYPLPQPAPLRVFNPYFQVPAINQAAYNAQIVGQLYRNAAWASGYTPYIGPVGSPVAPQLYANVPAYYGAYSSSPGSAYGGSPGYGYSGSPGYGYGGGWYYQDPFNGYLTGAAAVINAQGQFAKDWQTSRLMKEQVKQAAIDTQRKMFEEWQFERNNQPKLEQIRREAIEQAWQRAIFQPPANDIWSADALNRILDHASRIQSAGANKGREIPIDPEAVGKLNFSTGVAGNIGALRDKGKLSWPPILDKNDFDKERDRFSELAKDAVNQARANSRVERTTLDQMNEDIKSMTQKLSARVGDLDPSDYMEAKRYLKELSQAMKILQRKDVGKYLDGSYKAEGATAGELIKNMTEKGLRFAPAAQGDEAAYNALYQALVAYDLDLARKSPGKD